MDSHIAVTRHSSNLSMTGRSLSIVTSPRDVPRTMHLDASDSLKCPLTYAPRNVLDGFLDWFLKPWAVWISRVVPVGPWAGWVSRMVPWGLGLDGFLDGFPGALGWMDFSSGSLGPCAVWIYRVVPWGLGLVGFPWTCRIVLEVASLNEKTRKQPS